jgi:hypothetical protein
MTSKYQANSSMGYRTLVQSTAAGAGGVVVAGTAKAAGLLTFGKIAGVGILTANPLGAVVAIGLMAGMICGSALSRHQRNLVFAPV